jgi:hypothetical protein
VEGVDRAVDLAGAEEDRGHRAGQRRTGLGGGTASGVVDVRRSGAEGRGEKGRVRRTVVYRRERRGRPHVCFFLSLATSAGGF